MTVIEALSSNLVIQQMPYGRKPETHDWTGANYSIPIPAESRGYQIKVSSGSPGGRKEGVVNPFEDEIRKREREEGMLELMFKRYLFFQCSPQGQKLPDRECGIKEKDLK